MVTTALRSMFDQERVAEILSSWDDLAGTLAQRFLKAAALMAEVREDVLAFQHSPQPDWQKAWSTNLLERNNEEIKRCTRVVSIFPTTLQSPGWSGQCCWNSTSTDYCKGRRMFSTERIAAIPRLEDLPALPTASA